MAGYLNNIALNLEIVLKTKQIVQKSLKHWQRGFVKIYFYLKKSRFKS